MNKTCGRVKEKRCERPGCKGRFVASNPKQMYCSDFCRKKVSRDSRRRASIAADPTHRHRLICEECGVRVNLGRPRTENNLDHQQEKKCLSAHAGLKSFR